MSAKLCGYRKPLAEIPVPETKKRKIENQKKISEISIHTLTIQTSNLKIKESAKRRISLSKNY